MRKQTFNCAIVLCSVLWVNAIQAAPAKKPAPKKPSAKKAASKPAPTPAPRMVPLIIRLPRPPFSFYSRQKRINDLKQRPVTKPHPTLYVSEGTTNLARNKPITASDTAPRIGENSQITDGNKEAGDGNFVEYASGKQWVQIDLGKSANIYAIVLWHNFEFPLVYKDVVVQVSNEANFAKGVKTVFNNDYDNSSRLVKGSDDEYFELLQGQLIATKNTKGRYVRFYSDGSTGGRENRYTEIEIYGQ